MGAALKGRVGAVKLDRPTLFLFELKCQNFSHDNSYRNTNGWMSMAMMDEQIQKTELQQSLRSIESIRKENYVTESYRIY